MWGGIGDNDHRRVYITRRKSGSVLISRNGNKKKIKGNLQKPKKSKFVFYRFIDSVGWDDNKELEDDRWTTDNEW